MRSAPALRLALPLLALALGACLSVPLATIVRMGGFDTRDFAQLDPAVLRVRIKLPDGFELDAAKSALGARVGSAAGVHDASFRLEAEGVERALLAQRLLADDVRGRAYTLRLAAASQAEFRALQQFVRQGRPGEVQIRVVPILSAYPVAATSVSVWVDLLLSPQQGYFPLLDAAEVPMAAIREASAAAAAK